MEGSVTEDLADDQSPQQALSPDLLLDPSISRALEIPRQTQAAARVVFEVPGCGFAHRLRCLRCKASSCAFAANTSATASLNSRPASTRRRTSSTQSLGMRSTRFLPFTMKVSDQPGCPSPEAHRQVGFPQRLWVRDSEPASRSWGML